MDTLPVELKLMILSFLSQHAIVRGMGMVSREWKSLSRDSSLRRIVSGVDAPAAYFGPRTTRESLARCLDAWRLGRITYCGALLSALPCTNPPWLRNLCVDYRKPPLAPSASLKKGKHQRRHTVASVKKRAAIVAAMSRRRRARAVAAEAEAIALADMNVADAETTTHVLDALTLRNFRGIREDALHAWACRQRSRTLTMDQPTLVDSWHVVDRTMAESLTVTVFDSLLVGSLQSYVTHGGGTLLNITNLVVTTRERPSPHVLRLASLVRLFPCLRRVQLAHIFLSGDDTPPTIAAVAARHVGPLDVATLTHCTGGLQCALRLPVRRLVLVRDTAEHARYLDVWLLGLLSVENPWLRSCLEELVIAWCNDGRRHRTNPRLPPANGLDTALAQVVNEFPRLRLIQLPSALMCGGIGAQTRTALDRRCLTAPMLAFDDDVDARF